jgi:hypothetical protein
MEKNGALVQSIGTLLKDKGEMTEEAAELLVRVVTTWAGLRIVLDWGRDQQAFITGDVTDVNVVVCGGLKFKEFAIRTTSVSHGLVSAPPLAPGDPVSSTSLLRAISGAASLKDFEFPATVFPEANRNISIPLPVSAKPDALVLAQSIWCNVVSKLPHIKLADHTDLDAMGNLNLGSMFKVTSVLEAQGALSKYILCVIHEFQLVFLSGQNVVYVGSGIGKTAWLLSVLAQLDLNVFAFERHVPNHEASAQTLLQVRSNPKVHKLKVP